MRDDILRTLEKLLPPLVDDVVGQQPGASAYTFKSDHSLLTAADLQLQSSLEELLRNHWPRIAFLGEEMSAEQQLQLWDNNSEGLWCLDPLDGTGNFAMGIPFYAVSLALVCEHKVELGIVYDPVRRECFSAIRGQGAMLNGEPLQAPTAPDSLADTTAIVDFKRLPVALAKRLAAENPYRSQRSFGSVALDWCWLAAGRGHVYLHGRQRVWDYGAGRLILHEAGGLDCTLEGDAPALASLKPRSAVAALDPGLFQQWRQWLGLQDI